MTNALIARTKTGGELLRAAEAAGYLRVEREIGPADMSSYQPHQVTKKYAVWARYVGLRAAAQLAPETERLRIRDLARKNRLSFNLVQARETRRRAREGKTREPPPESRASRTESRRRSAAQSRYSGSS